MKEADQPTFEDFLSVHEGQLLASKIPQHFWPTIFHKLRNQTLDAGDYFQIIMEENEEGNKFSVVAIKDLNEEDENNIFLVDHAWTFRLNSARAGLEELDSLRENLASIFGIKKTSNDEVGDTSSAYSDLDDPIGGNNSQAPSTSHGVPRKQNTLDLAVKEANERQKQINLILNEMWRYIQTYTIRVAKSVTDESDMPIWYLPDDFGIRVGHSFTPNCRMVPFFYAFQRMAYTLLFPSSAINDTEEVTRNYLDHILFHGNPEWRSFLMNPWEPYNYFTEPAAGELNFIVKNDDYFLSGRALDELPNTENLILKQRDKKIEGSICVFADDFQLFERLRDVKVTTAKSLFTADFIWLRKHFHSFRELAEKNPSALVNQFPYESSLLVKDLFAAIVQHVYAQKLPNGGFDTETLDWQPKWLPTTFNLQMELPQFVRYFYEREKRGLDNTWIVKPFNLARGLDVFVTRNVNSVIRLAESGPKIVCKYIHNPVLFQRPDSENFVKFDLRFIVFLRSLKPLDVVVYNKFWIRFAVNEFNLERLDDNLTHLTVHNYNPEVNVLNMDCDKFVEYFEQQNANLKWADIDREIKALIKEIFRTMTIYDPPRGMAANPQSRAMYGFDLMLQWKDDLKKEVQVSFIEANFMPDCTRACDFYPDFADTAFRTMFFDESGPNVSLL